MATDLHKGVSFEPNFAKKWLKMTKSSNACQSFKITAKACETFRIDLSFHVLFEKVIYNWVGLPDFREGQMENLG